MADAHEEWRPVVGFSGAYSVSCLGRVRSEERQVRNNPNGGVRTVKTRILKQHPAKGGYLHVWLYRAEGVKAVKVASAVARAFLGPNPRKLDVCHINGRNTDNRASNLKYGTRKQNMADARRHGTLARGERQGKAKLTCEQIRAIRIDPRKLKEIATDFGISFQHVSYIKKRLTWAWLK